MKIFGKVMALYDRLESAPLNPVWIPWVSSRELPWSLALAHGHHTAASAGLTFAVKATLMLPTLPQPPGCPAYASPPSERDVVRTSRDGRGISSSRRTWDQFATGLVGHGPFGACSCSSNGAVHFPVARFWFSISVSSVSTFSLGTETGSSGRVPAALKNNFDWPERREACSAPRACPGLPHARLRLHPGSLFEWATGFWRAAPGFRSRRSIFARTSPLAMMPLPGGNGPFPGFGGLIEQLEFFSATKIQGSVIAESGAENPTARRRANSKIDFFRLFAKAATLPLLTKAPGWAERLAAIRSFLRDHSG